MTIEITWTVSPYVPDKWTGFFDGDDVAEINRRRPWKIYEGTVRVCGDDDDITRSDQIEATVVHEDISVLMKKLEFLHERLAAVLQETKTP